jgi:outer membrane protein OmpA-like peptidoglycan-associated protein
MAAASAALSVILLAGCGGVSDSLNPARWYQGVADWVSGSPERPSQTASSDKWQDTWDKDKEGSFPKVPDDKRPTPPSAKQVTQLSEGLTADRAKGKETQAAANKDSGQDKWDDTGGQGETFPTLPADKRPKPPPAKDVTQVPEGLGGDQANAKYTQDTLRREGNPTRPLSPEAATSKPAASAGGVSMQMAAASSSSTAAAAPSQAPAATAPSSAVVPDKPVVDISETPPPPPRNLAAAASPAAASAAAAPQSAAVPVPAAVQAPAPAAPRSLQEVYRQRLAEFNASPSAAVQQSAPTLSRPATAATSMPTQSSASSGDGQTVALTPPSQLRRNLARETGGAQPLSAFDGAKSAASFRVATVEFGESTTELTAEGLRRIKAAAAIERRDGGTVRVLGHSASPRLDPNPEANREANLQLATRRAEITARELVRLGVPARKIYAGAALDGPAAQPTEIYIDY